MPTGIPVAAAIVAAAAVGTAGMAVAVAISVAVTVAAAVLAVTGESERFKKRSPFGRTRRAYRIQALRLDLKLICTNVLYYPETLPPSSF